MTIDNLKSLFELLSNDYQLNSVSGSEFNALANLAQRDYFNFLIGHVEQFQPGRPVPRIGLGMGDGVMYKLSPFRKTANLVVTAGVLAKPLDFHRLQRMTYGTQAVTRLDPSELNSALTSVVTPVAVNPRYVDGDSLWLIYPSGTHTVTLDYIASPTDMKWNYTSQNQREKYLATGSVHPEWHDTEINHILSRMLKHLGVPFKDGELINIANNQIQAGE